MRQALEKCGLALDRPLSAATGRVRMGKHKDAHPAPLRARSTTMSPSFTWKLTLEKIGSPSDLAHDTFFAARRGTMAVCCVFDTFEPRLFQTFWPSFSHAAHRKWFRMQLLFVRKKEVRMQILRSIMCECHARPCGIYPQDAIF